MDYLRQQEAEWENTETANISHLAASNRAKNGAQVACLNGKHVSSGRELGRGAFGVVLLGKFLGSDVAIKRLFEDNLHDNIEVDLMREARQLVNLHHPHVTQLFGVVVEPWNSRYDIVMEKLACSLEDSWDKLKRSSVGYKCMYGQAMTVLLQVASALAFLHTRTPKIIHRDLKPANVLLASSLGANARITAKLSDFGLATVKKGRGNLYDRAGTPLYEAPEMRHGLGYSEKADIWSFGVMAVELLTGHMVNPDNPYFEIGSWVHPGVGAVISKCLRSPNARPTAVELVEELTRHMPLPSFLFKAPAQRNPPQQRPQLFKPRAPAQRAPVQRAPITRVEYTPNTPGAPTVVLPNHVTQQCAQQ